MRALLLVTAAALIAVPAAAQDHSAHAEHEASPQEAPAGASEAEAHEGMGHGEMNHDAMGHAGVHGEMDHAEMDHGAMDHEAMDHGAMGHGQMDRQSDPRHAGMDHGTTAQADDEHAAPGAAPAASAPPPPRALAGPAHAADAIYGQAAMAPARAELAQMDTFAVGTVLLERLEARIGEGEDLYLWDAQAWYGGDYNKLWLKSEGEGAFAGGVESAEIQALWSHAIDPWFDLQAGVRYDIEPKGRAHAVLGVQGLAPYMFEVDAAAFLSDKGDLTARIEAEYDQRITQRLILQPRAEASLAAQDIPELGIGAGVSSIEAGLRLRYEFAREFAPYVGIGYEARLGDTADYARGAGEDPDRFSLLMGVRAWF